MGRQRKIVLIIPFWHRPNHLSAIRAGRFIRWLTAENWEVILVRASDTDKVIEQSWGREVAICDPLGLHPENPSAASAQGAKEYSPLVTLGASLVFTPDPGILWARRAARHSLVLKHGRDASAVLSTSPPESAHLCAASLAKRLGSELIVDMRDGWLDEPLKPLLQKFLLQRLREGRLERRVLQQAKKVFVTSQVWKDLLVKRLPRCEEKTVVLTNAYPLDGMEVLSVERPRLSPKPSLLYAGQLSLSRSTQNASLLLGPLFAGIVKAGGEGKITFLGKMAPKDSKEIDTWRDRFATVGWPIKVISPVPREEAWERIASADGLLLLCEALAAVPSKLFEYIAARKPVFSVSPRESAVSKLTDDLPQFFSVDSAAAVRGEGGGAVEKFLEACTTQTAPYPLPQEYCEDWLAKVFLQHVC